MTLRIPPFALGPNIDELNATKALSQKDFNEFLAAKIQHQWLVAGHDVKCRVVSKLDNAGRLVCHEIRSSLVNGLPAKNG